MADASSSLLQEETVECICEERHSCASVGNVAEFFCLECGTHQCSQCESIIHSTRELKQHSRERLVHKKRRRKPREPKPESSFLLVNGKEEIEVSEPEDFIARLGCRASVKVKVVSIFGNTGDGKSHTLNHTFFQGREVFRTSAHQSSCTIGIWAAYSPDYAAIFIDTEGMLGTSPNENQRTRLLLKVLAISDIVIYRTRAERLHNDLFTFLGDASEAYWKYFTPELKAASERCKLNVPLSTLGPSVIIFHETQHTEILGEGATPGPHKGKNTGSGIIEAEDRPHSSALTMREGGSSEGDYDMMEDASLAQECTVQEQPRHRKQPQPHSALEEYRTAETKIYKEETPAVESPGTATNTPMSAEELLRIRFAELGCIPRAFCSVEYVGTRTSFPPTDFSSLQTSVTDLLRNNAVRAPRQPEVVLKALQVLNEKFSGDIDRARPTTFPDAYFTCPQLCLACGARCELSMNHGKDGVPHRVRGMRCKYSHQYDNKIYLCKACYNQGTESVVVPKTSSAGDSGWMGIAKYAWSGYVIECENCGVIYRSRKHWYGNKEPEQAAVKTENKHIWPEDLSTPGQGSENTVRKILDGMGSVAGAVSSVSMGPTTMVCGWVTDQIAPGYWVPNSKITVCGECKEEFQLKDTKHHCRACGGGFCNKCSSNSIPVPERGWGNIPVRVCNTCYQKRTKGEKLKPHRASATNTTPHRMSKEGHPTDASAKTEKVTARYVGEVMQSAVGAVTGVMAYPRGVIVESARPVYWVPDADIKCCQQCKREFGPSDSKHHCRACGQGFCNDCSSQQKAVPSRGWDYLVRVCDSCARRQDL